MTDAETAPRGIKELLDARWSCRAFLPDQVPDEVVAEILAIAQRTASWCNTQPWHVHITRGEATRRFAKSLTAYSQENEPAPDMPAPAGYFGVYRDRRRAAGFALYKSLGITREDADRRDVQHLRNYAFFDAPHVAIISTDRNQGVYGAVDCGAFVANFINAATSLGIATIPQAAIAMHSPHVREFVDLPEDRMVVCAISFGFPDLDDPVNTFRTERAVPGEAATFIDS